MLDIRLKDKTIFKITVVSIVVYFIWFGFSLSDMKFSTIGAQYAYGFLEKHRARNGPYVILETSGEYDHTKLSISEESYRTITKPASCIKFIMYVQYKKSAPSKIEKSYGLEEQINLTKIECTALQESVKDATEIALQRIISQQP